MRILITNDDGYRSEGIAALQAALCDHEVWMLAPSKNMSACSQSITPNSPLRIYPLHDARSFSCDGTPADCVILGLKELFDVTFDCVVSGINIGPNLGDDITFSGTVAAARQGTLMGIPSIAISLFDEVNKHPYFFTSVAKQVCSRLDSLLALTDTDHFVNVNVPNIDARMQFALTTPSVRLYEDHVSSFTPPNSNERFCYMSATPHNITPREGTDWAAVEDGRVSVSVIHVHPLAKHLPDYVFTD